MENYYKITDSGISSLREQYRKDTTVPSTSEDVKKVTKNPPSNFGGVCELIFPRCIEIDEDTGDEYTVAALWEDMDRMWFIRLIKVKGSGISLSAVIPKKITD